MKRLLVALLLFAMLAQQPAIPQALPAANFVINRAIGGVISRIAAARGFAANDPRIIATNAAISSNLTALNVASTGVGVGLTMLGAPVWLTLLAGLGVVAGGAAVVAYFGDKKVEIGGDGSGRVFVATPPPKNNEEKTAYPGINGAVKPGWLGAYALEAGFNVYRMEGCLATDLCSPFPLKAPTGTYVAVDKTWIEIPTVADVERWLDLVGERIHGGAHSNHKLREVFDLEGSFDHFEADFTSRVYDFVKVSCPRGECWEKQWVVTQYSNYVGEGYANVYGVGNLYQREHPTGETKWYGSLPQAYEALPKNVQEAQISNETMARVVDNAWRLTASQEGYQGLPYQLTQPVTEADVDAWIRARPNIFPSINDLFRPATLPGRRTVPISPSIEPMTKPDPSIDPRVDPKPDPKINPQASENVNVVNTPNVNVINRPTVDVGNPVKVDLGTAPQVATPTLAEPPTGAMILDPILKMLPGFSDWKTPKYAAECPRPTFELFSKRIRMDAMCDLAEKYRPMITSIMLAVFVLIAATIVLAA